MCLSVSLHVCQTQAYACLPAYKFLDKISHHKNHICRSNLTQTLWISLPDAQTELEQLHENISDTESTLSNLRQDIRAEQQKRDTAHTEAQRLADAIRQSNAAYEEALRQERAKEEELHDLVRGIEDREREHDDARKVGNVVDARIRMKNSYI